MTAQARHEAPELGAAVARMLNALIRRAAEGDQEALEALAGLEDLTRQATTSALTLARDRYSLNELATVTGTSRQAVSQRADLHQRPKVTTAPCEHHRCVGVKRCRVVCVACGSPIRTAHGPGCSVGALGLFATQSLKVTLSDCELVGHVL